VRGDRPRRPEHHGHSRRAPWRRRNAHAPATQQRTTEQARVFPSEGCRSNAMHLATRITHTDRNNDHVLGDACVTLMQAAKSGRTTVESSRTFGAVVLYSSRPPPVTVEVFCPPDGAARGVTPHRGQAVPVANSDRVGISDLSFAPSSSLRVEPLWSWTYRWL